MNLYNIMRSVTDGYKEARPNRRDWEYGYLASAPVLHSSEYLTDLLDGARNRDQEDCILEHINKHDAWDVDSYRNVGNQIIDKRWR